MKKIIESTLPVKELSQSAIVDKVHKGHPGNLHLWWNRSPINSSAAVLKAALEDDERGDITNAESKNFKEELVQISKGNLSEGKVKNYKNYPVICDPFSGFGGLTIAAQKIGLNVDASDLNSVACLLTKAATEIPSRFIDCKAINPDADNRLYFGSEGLASDIGYYGTMLKEITYNKLKPNYPLVKVPGLEEKAYVYAWIWVRTAKCPNPACGCEMPLANSYVLSRTKGHEFWAEPEIIGKKVHFKIHKGICPSDKQTNKHGQFGAKFQCPSCGEITKDDYVKRAGRAGGLGLQLMAICVQTSDGKIFVEPSEDQIKTSKMMAPEDLPIGSLPNNTRWFSPPEFGETEYTDLYNNRQLCLMTTLCDAISDIIEQATLEAEKAGMSKDMRSLSNGGTGAFAYGQAIGVYLALVISKLTNYQSSVCTWDDRNGNIRAAFTRQAIPMTWVFAEGNPFSTVTGNYDSILQSVIQSVAELQNNGPVIVKQEDAIKKEFPKDSILFTELPYYDNIGYADLSDYFYIWLRRCLKGVYPGLFEKVVTSKEELSSIPEHFEGDGVKAINSYRQGIKQMLRNFHEKCSDKFPSIIFFEYSKEDDRAICSDELSCEITSIESLFDSMVQEGFMVTGLWPVRTEKANPKYDSIRIAVVFRKNTEDFNSITRRNFINILKRELPRKLDVSLAEDMYEEDKPIVGLGLGLSIFTRYKKVINADGSDMNIQDALKLIHREVEDYIERYVANEYAKEV